MAILTIRHAPDPVLSAPTRPVTTVTPEIRQLVRDMIDTMYAASGVGLSANQVGHPIQLFIASADQVRGREIVLVNPEILIRRGRVRLEEGCLSLPGIMTVVTRAAQVRVRGLTLDGTSCEVDGQELPARIFQHEIDHLHGLLFVNRLSWWRRTRLMRRYQQQQRELTRVAL